MPALPGCLPPIGWLCGAGVGYYRLRTHPPGHRSGPIRLDEEVGPAPRQRNRRYSGFAGGILNQCWVAGNYQVGPLIQDVSRIGPGTQPVLEECGTTPGNRQGTVCKETRQGVKWVTHSNPQATVVLSGSGFDSQRLQDRRAATPTRYDPGGHWECIGGGGVPTLPEYKSPTPAGGIGTPRQREARSQVSLAVNPDQSLERLSEEKLLAVVGRNRRMSGVNGFREGHSEGLSRLAGLSQNSTAFLMAGSD
jgi:hypothetical protein